MATNHLKLYTDRAVRSQLAKSQLDQLGISYEEVNVEDDSNSVVFLESQGRDRKHHPLPQYYVGDKLAWENGYKDVVALNATQINSKIEELNAG
jgi:hypothetical protein